MAFSSWSAVRDDLKTAIADMAGGAPGTKQYTIGGKTMIFRDVAQIQAFYEMTYKLEAMDDAGNPATMTSYGRYRRFS